MNKSQSRRLAVLVQDGPVKEWLAADGIDRIPVRLAQLVDAINTAGGFTNLPEPFASVMSGALR